MDSSDQHVRRHFAGRFAPFLLWNLEKQSFPVHARRSAQTPGETMIGAGYRQHIATMRKQLLLALILAALSLRCASIAHGRYQRVAVRSTPSGAQVAVNCGDAPASPGVTPLDIWLRRGAEKCTITLSHSGYADRTITFTRATSGVAWANAAPGLVVGVAAGAAAALPFGGTQGSVNNALLGGTAVGSGIGLAVDRATGAIFRQIPSEVDVTLDAPVTSATAAKP
jgi:hypothetical protein